MNCGLSLIAYFFNTIINIYIVFVSYILANIQLVGILLLCFLQRLHAKLMLILWIALYLFIKLVDSATYNYFWLLRVIVSWININNTLLLVLWYLAALLLFIYLFNLPIFSAHARCTHLSMSIKVRWRYKLSTVRTFELW